MQFVECSEVKKNYEQKYRKFSQKKSLLKVLENCQIF